MQQTANKCTAYSSLPDTSSADLTTFGQGRLTKDSTTEILEGDKEFVQTENMAGLLFVDSVPLAHQRSFRKR